MTYRVVFHAKADAETFGLPDEAFTALIERLVAVARDPYDPQVTLATSDPQIRRATFGGVGLCSFHVDDSAHVVQVFGITWAG